MTLTNVVRLNVYTTDVDTLLQHFTVVTERFEGKRFATTLLLQHFTVVTERFEGKRFATTLLGVASLAGPDLLVALEATAMD